MCFLPWKNFTWYYRCVCFVLNNGRGLVENISRQCLRRDNDPLKSRWVRTQRIREDRDSETSSQFR